MSAAAAGSSPADGVSLFGPAMRDDPYSLYDRLRAADPVHWSEADQGWLVTSYDAVVAGLNDLRLSSDRAAVLQRWANDESLAPFFSFLSRRMILTDPPRHTRLRGLVSRAFTPAAVESMRPHVQSIIDRLLDGVAASARMDFIRDFAYPLPATVIMEMLGLPEGDRDQLKLWADQFVVFFSTHPAKVSHEEYRRALDAMQAMTAYFRSVMPAIRSRDDSCLMNVMAGAAADGDRLTEDELYANANLLLIAGHETTTHLLANGLHALLTHPDQCDLVRSDPSRIPGAVEELLRLVGPVQFTHRVALEDVPLGGRSIRRGDFVFLFLAAANRDPIHFPEPNRLDVTRPAHKHVAMGLGHHFCLGAPLARLEVQLALESVFRRLPKLRLADGPLEYQGNVNLHGFKALPVRWD